MSGFIPTLNHPSGHGELGCLVFRLLSDSDLCVFSDPKDVAEEEYLDFYRATFKDYRKPISWHQFAGDAAGTSFKGILYIPEKMFAISPCLCNFR